MTNRYRRAGLIAVVCLGSGRLPLAGQATGSLAVGASLIGFDGFLSSGAAVFAPSLQFDTPRLSLAGQGSWTVFESGNNVWQANATAGWLTGSRGWWRLELSGSAGASKYATEPGSGHLLAGARVHVFSSQAGGWVGLAAGQSFGRSALGFPIELTMAGWHVRHRLTLVGTATATGFGGVRYLDLVGTMRWASPGVEFEGRLGARPWVRFAGGTGEVNTGGYGEVTALVPLSQRLAVSLGGGSHLSDPVRRVLGARYVSAGIRLKTFGPPARVVRAPGLTAIMRWLGATDNGAGRLEIGPSGPVRAVRVHAAGAARVELMGDFTDWAIVALTQVGPGVWEVHLPITPGIYRVNVRFDGGSWTVPAGTRIERTEFGSVGVVVVSGSTN